jgi:hypothetical protein
MKHTIYHDINTTAFRIRRFIMIRFFPTAWTAGFIALTSMATWLLCATDALGGVPPLFFH